MTYYTEENPPNYISDSDSTWFIPPKCTLSQRIQMFVYRTLEKYTDAKFGRHRMVITCFPKIVFKIPHHRSYHNFSFNNTQMNMEELQLWKKYHQDDIFCPIICQIGHILIMKKLKISKDTDEKYHILKSELEARIKKLSNLHPNIFTDAESHNLGYHNGKLVLVDYSPESNQKFDNLRLISNTN